MRLWHLLLLCTLAFGSVLPHCAAATPVRGEAVHHMAMGHDTPTPATAHVSDACIGCATPVRLAVVMPLAPLRVELPMASLLPRLATRFTALDPPPPRPAA